MVAVKPSVQGHGVGGRLMKAMLERVGEAPCFLECTNPQNISFYEKFGFELVEAGPLIDEQHPERRVDLFYMMKDGKTEKI